MLSGKKTIIITIIQVILSTEPENPKDLKKRKKKNSNDNNDKVIIPTNLKPKLQVYIM